MKINAIVFGIEEKVHYLYIKKLKMADFVYTRM